MGKKLYQIADIDPTTRPFQLTIEEFGRICQAYISICDQDPRLYKYNYRGSRKESDLFQNEIVLEQTV